MSYQFPATALTFLSDLADNNSKAWMDANRKRYERELKGPGRELVAAIDDELARISPAHVTPPAKAISRINRDIRFSKDKTPYNTNLWAGFQDGSRAKGNSAGFYFGLSPGHLGVGGGLYMVPKDKLAQARAYVAAHHQDLSALMGALGSDYSDLQGDKLKRVPKPFDPEHPAGEWLKHKGWFVMRDLDPELITSPDLVPTITTCFEEMKPLVQFFDRALA